MKVYLLDDRHADELRNIDFGRNCLLVICGSNWGSYVPVDIFDDPIFEKGKDVVKDLTPVDRIFDNEIIDAYNKATPTKQKIITDTLDITIATIP